MIDKQTFRDAMSRLAAAVTVVTSDGPGGLCGCTASAVCSVSDAPPVLLVCINRASRNNAILKQNQALCVNILRAGQQEMALRFAQSSGPLPGDQRFSDGGWSRDGADGAAPFLPDALVSLDCRITDIAEIGSHTVFYCTVDAVRFGEAAPALVYFARGFHDVPGRVDD